MPRGDGTGPWGTGPVGRGRGGCQPMGFFNQFGLGFCRNGFGRANRQGGMQSGFNFANDTPVAPETLEAQAKLLESQANDLRNLAKQNHTAK